MFKDTVLEKDEYLHTLIYLEKYRQKNSIQLIASENFTSPAVMEILGSVLTNKYSEGRIGKRYYGGNEFIDKIEELCENRALDAFKLDKYSWAIDVQPLSGSPANFAVYTGLLNPHDRIMGLGLTSGGHLTHGFYQGSKKITASSIYFESLPYHIKSDGHIDYDKLEEQALLFRPKLIICGGSAYPCEYDYKRFREIADKVNAYLMCDMAHISGLVATQEADSPFDYCDVVTSTTHKTLRGPRAGMIFMKKEFETQIKDAVFPALQGGPHQNQIGALAYQLNEVRKPEFKQYIQQVKSNAKALANRLKELGYYLSSGDTVNHLLLVKTKDKGLTGSKMEKICDIVNISINKNTLYGDSSPMNPSGIRIGTPAMTTRGWKENEFIQLADLLDEILKFGLVIQEKTGKKLVDFVDYINKNPYELDDIKFKVAKLTNEFPFYIT